MSILPYFLCSFLQRQFLCSQGIFYDMKVLSKVHCSHAFLSWKCTETQVSLYFLFREEVAQKIEFWGHFSRYESIRLLISCSFWSCKGTSSSTSSHFLFRQEVAPQTGFYSLIIKQNFEKSFLLSFSMANHVFFILKSDS